MKKFVVGIFLVLSLCFLFPNFSHAANDVQAEIKKDGEDPAGWSLQWTLDATKATNSIKWKTVGWYVTTKPYKGTGSSSSKDHQKCFWDKDYRKAGRVAKSINRNVGSSVKTTFTLSWKNFYSIFRDLEPVEYTSVGKAVVYLQGILVAYKKPSGVFNALC